MESLLAQSLADWIAQYGAAVYLLLFAIVFLEIGVAPLFFLPGDPLLFLCGAFCASGALRLSLLLPMLALAAFGGSCLAYGLGRRLGGRAEARAWRWLNHEALKRAHAFFARHGGLTLLVSPYVAVLRTFAPLAAGLARMEAARFAPAAAAGSLLWSAGLLVGGYFFGHIPLVHDHIGAVTLLGLVLGLGGLLLRQRRRRAAN